MSISSLHPVVKIFNFLIFSSIYIALCAALMTYQSFNLLHLHYDNTSYLLFVFFSTLCSYNFHWRLTPASDSEMLRVQWTRGHKTMQLIFIGAGMAAAIWFAFTFIQHWFWLGVSVLLTFLYSAPKLPYPVFNHLKKIAIGKTIFLAFVWAYVTTALPVLIDNTGWNAEKILFLASRFFLVYAICILFDRRDREQDKKDGIRSMVTLFSESNVKRLFYFSLLAFLFSTAMLYFQSMSLPVVIALLAPGAIVWSLYGYSGRNYSDYLYYFILDGLMMLSALFTSLMPF